MRCICSARCLGPECPAQACAFKGHGPCPAFKRSGKPAAEFYRGVR